MGARSRAEHSPSKRPGGESGPGEAAGDPQVVLLQVEVVVEGRVFFEEAGRPAVVAGQDDRGVGGAHPGGGEQRHDVRQDVGLDQGGGRWRAARRGRGRAARCAGAGRRRGLPRS